MRWLSVLAAVADLSVGLILMIFQVHWDVFKSLCGIGHTFDAHYGVEIGTPDEIYEDFCVYSNIEQMTLAASCVQLILDILVLLALLQILPELPLQAEARREAIKKLSAGLGAFSGAAFDSRSGSTKNPQLRDLESPEGWDDFGVGISLGSGRKRNSRRSTASPDEEDLDGLLSARRDSPRRQRKRSQRNSRREETKAPRVLSVEDIDSEDIELGQLFAPVKATNGNSSRRRASVRGVPGVPGSARSSSPRKTESPRKIGRPEVDWQTSEAASLSSWGTVEVQEEGATANLFLSMRTSATGLPQEDELEAAKRLIEEDDQDFGTDFFAYALWVSEKFETLGSRRRVRSQAGMASDACDSLGELAESSLSELFHPPLQPVSVTRLWFKNIFASESMLYTQLNQQTPDTRASQEKSISWPRFMTWCCIGAGSLSQLGHVGAWRMESFLEGCEMWLSKCNLLRESRAPASWDWPSKC